MKKRISLTKLFSMVIILLTFFFSTIILDVQAQDAQKFAEYRAAIKKQYGIDIKNFKEKLKGGRADGQPIIKYDLQQLIMGIEVELEHAKDKMTALEIAMDHLEEIPDYYTRLEKMEEEAEAEWKEKKKEKK